MSDLQVAIGLEDVEWATRILGLPSTAFTGPDGTDPRCQLLRSMQSHDIAACPGSGKTTLLIAKLAILAKKWNSRTQGICALSHTNVARDEIEKRLANTDIARSLLSYPHFIGTIHSFVGEFLALPWMRSRGYPVKLIDSGICEKRRWAKLKYGTRSFFEKKNIGPSDLCLSSVSFAISKKSGTVPCGESTQSYQDIMLAARTTTEEGYHCYEDLFLWANDMIDKFPNIVDIIRMRFPILFIDEAQDNSEQQSAILHRVFKSGQSRVIRQRLGDANQAIFDSPQNGDATTDKFPDESLKQSVPNSHRFGQTLADFADPLGLTPYGLRGQGPLKKPLTSGELEGKHTIFIFSESNIKHVLETYGDLLLNTFSDEELRQGTFTAVGHIHSPSIPDATKVPQHLGDYWDRYDPDMAPRSPRLQSFLQFVRTGASRADQEKEAHPYVNKIAEGILRLASILVTDKHFAPRSNPHRQLLRNLQESSSGKKCYQDLLSTLAIKRPLLAKADWDECCKGALTVAKAIVGNGMDSKDVREFLEWKDEVKDPAIGGRSWRDNTFRHVKGDRQAIVRIGSIHAAKGETHTATLVLETFWHKHSLRELIPWLSGDKTGQTGKPQLDLRLKVHYVAMTRPTHLLCLAMCRKSFLTGNGALDDALIGKLEARKWQIVKL
jgi:DNA helicase II / ATP-dependent DNA helicase PcrA